jgi:D-amino-acid oxidase
LGFNKKEILVLGAGVSGLSTALLLLKEGYKVAIWTKDFPSHTTSSIAAALWFPYLCNPKDKAIRWCAFTLQYLKQHALNDSESGCATRTFIEFFDKKVGEPWWKEAVESYQRPQKDELPEGYVDGYKTEVIVMDSSKYLDWLLKQYKALGGVLLQKIIKTIDESFDEYDVVVNCTGLGSRELFNDEAVYPVRGQTVTIKSNGFEKVLTDTEGLNSLAGIIPRLNDIILGGTSQANDWNLEIDPNDTKDILKKAKALSPFFNDVQIIEIKVGLRPVRKEVRLEIESFGNKYVVHNYGHGGAGYTLSWGCAADVVKLVKSI